MPAMSEARLLMVEHCRGRFQAVEVQDAVEFRCRVAPMARDAQQVALTETRSSRGL
jgi:hypothetical protein